MEDISTLKARDSFTCYPKTCLICFETDKNIKKLYDLFEVDPEQITLLEKLQSFSQEKLWVSEFTLLCESCLCDLNKALEFKKKIYTSQDAWRNVSIFCRVPSEKHSLDEVSSDGLVHHTNNIQVLTEDEDNFSSSLGNFNTEVSTKDLKADVLAEQSFSYYSCRNCDAVFANSDEFSAHKCDVGYNVISYTEDNQATTVVNSRYSCDLCGKIFKDKNIRDRHKVKVHFQEKIYTCNFCNKSFKQKYHLKEHLTSHTGEKNYPCPLCNKIFQRISSQKRHMKSHNKSPGEKTRQTPFLCTICGKSFPYSNGVQRHLRIHSGEKKYECKECGKKFSQSTHLHVHVRTHTGAKPYMCNSCGDSFSLNAALHKHVVSSHPDEQVT